ncbi:hypothetical protein [Kitasatospora sp. NBC_00315]|uniref:hypothetical protein n=1 Tax=Kitasatospora sp. NBC_00315 TaxID=2975963 RepID=UPI00324F6EBD
MTTNVMTLPGTGYEGQELTGAERAALELAGATGARVEAWLLVLAGRVLEGADPVGEVDGPLFALGGSLRRVADTVAAVTSSIDPAGEGDVDHEQRYELTALVRFLVMEAAGRRLLTRAERVALLAVGALVLEMPGAVLGDFDQILPEVCAAIGEAMLLAAADGPASGPAR